MYRPTFFGLGPVDCLRSSTLEAEISIGDLDYLDLFPMELEGTLLRPPFFLLAALFFIFKINDAGRSLLQAGYFWDLSPGDCDFVIEL